MEQSKKSLFKHIKTCSPAKLHNFNRMSVDKQLAYTEFCNMMNDVLTNFELDPNCCDSALIQLNEHFIPIAEFWVNGDNCLIYYYPLISMQVIATLLTDYIEKRDANIPIPFK